jgi:hypothetical protein
MKNHTVRIRKNGGKKASVEQVQMNSVKASEETVHFCIADEGGRLFTEFKLRKSEYEYIRSNAESRGLKPGQLIQVAIEENLIKSRTSLSLLKLENVVTQTNSLLKLLADKIEHLAYVDGCDFSDEEAKSYATGISFLVRDVGATLMKAFYSVNAANAGTKELAS